MRGGWVFAVLAVIAVGVIAFVVSKRPAEVPAPAPSASASWPVTPRMKREVLRGKILSAILDEASAPPPREEPAREGRSLTKALVGVPEVKFPADYLEQVQRDHLAPLARKCLDDADAGAVSVRYVVISSPGIGGVIEDATLEVENDDLEECIRDAALDLTFERTPPQGGWQEVTFGVRTDDH